MGQSTHDHEAAVDRVVVILLTLLVALIGADRINLLAGAASFLLTPFLALTPVILLAEAARLGMTRGTVRVPRQAALYFLVASALLAVVGISSFLSGDPALSGKRTILLVAQVQGTLLLAITLLNQERPADILVRGAYLGLILTTIFNVFQVYYWVTGNWDPGRPEAEMFVNLTPRTYGGWVPRLSGTVVDQGRTGLMMVVYMFLIFRFARASKLRTGMIILGALSLLGTLSRAGVLCALVAWGVYWLIERRLRFGTRQAFALAGAVAGIAVLLMFSPLLPTGSLEVLAPLTGRFSVDEGSSRMHLDLIQHGFLVATSSFQNLLLGIGYGNGLMVLEDFFPGDRYANFHSYYITLLAEAGVVALILGCWLQFHPFLVRWGPFVPLIAGFVVYNVFYQSTTEPAFWLVLALAWLTPGGWALNRPASERPATVQVAGNASPTLVSA